MSSAVRRAAIHWLAAHRPTDSTGQLRVDALIREHETACVAEEGEDPACPPCQYQHRCLRGGGCPIRNPEAGNA
ncbi:hypothetical protein [Azohydromonas lata]|uniref:hypothetical protein n=1 Tax=Azohydromonas lata TaxID=45677 RepID=UPI000833D0E0|nr:hypothetical protein [Azohydromonas lata]